MIEPEISYSAMFRICKKAGAHRVSEPATKEQAKTLEIIGVKIAKMPRNMRYMRVEKPLNLKI